MICPICNSSKFQDRAGRKNSQCVSCKAMERTRLLYMVLKKFGVLNSNIKILHLEPEGALMKIFTELSPSGYFPCSVNQNNYDCRIYKLESSCDIDKFPRQCFDLIVHNHFLGKIPLPLNYTLKVFSEILKPSGYHFFTAVIENGLTNEALEELSYKERIKQFGNPNRFHKFGRDDFIPLLQNLWNNENVYIKNEKIFSLQEYLNAALSEKLFSSITSSTIFCQKGSLVK